LEEKFQEVGGGREDEQNHKVDHKKEKKKEKTGIKENPFGHPYCKGRAREEKKKKEPVGSDQAKKTRERNVTGVSALIGQVSSSASVTHPFT